MQDLTDHKALVRWLTDLLQQGIAVGDEVTDYAAATFGTADLPSLLTTDADCEIDSLMELLFYPDVAAQLRYESRWGQVRFTARQLSQIEAALCDNAIKVPLLLSANNDPLWIHPPDFALAAYVRRLNITWQIQGPLAHTIATAWPGDAGLRMRVHLRNARLPWHPDQIRLMNAYLSKEPAENEAVESGLRFLLSILPEMEPGTDGFDFLMSKKFFFFQSLCKAEDFERRRSASNMEIMMLQGNRSAYGSLDDWRLKMRRIDDICRHLFGRTNFFQQPDGASIDLQAGADGQHVKDVMRILS